jgi:hypothetical protein
MIFMSTLIYLYKIRSTCLAVVAVIIATWEAEIRRIIVRGQPMQIVPKHPISKITKVKLDWQCSSISRVPALQVKAMSSNHSLTKKEKIRSTYLIICKYFTR